MKSISLSSLAAGVFAAALLTSCTTPAPAGKSAAAAVTFPAGVPERPEKLQFPPLAYEPPKPSEFRVPLAAGPVAYIMPDRELPLVNIVIYVRTGEYTVPKGKEGLSEMAGSLLVRGGTEAKSAEALEEQLDFLAARLSSSVGETQGSVSLNLLSKDLDAGLAILREVLTTPRFQEDKIKLQKDQMVLAMKQRNDDSADIEKREQGFLAFGDTFWANQYPTAASVEALTREDLKAFHQKWFHPANFVVAASGDFDREEMKARLEKLFADWPFKGETPLAIPTDLHFAAPGVYLVNKDVNQGRVSLMLPGVMRDAPDFFAVTVMNRILGGGGFTSRIMNRVRSDEGLAYSAYSSFPGGVYYPLPFEAGFQSKSRTVAYATSIVIEEMKRIAAEPVSAEELETEKRSIIDTFPRAFSTTAQVAARYAEDEFTGRYARQPEYWQNYRSRVAAVTREDVQAAAKKHLETQRLVILVVGQKEEILRGQPDRAVSLAGLAGGKVMDVPLRDPLTMQPAAK